MRHRGWRSWSLALTLIAATGWAAAAPAGTGRPAGSTASTTAGERHSIGYRRMLSFPRRPVQLRVPRLGRDVERRVLKNGMVLYLMEDHRLPIVRISAIIRAGTYFV